MSTDENAVNDQEVREVYEERRKPDPIHIDNIDGLHAGTWLAAHDAEVRAEQREVSARIAESDQFYGENPSSDEISYDVARREAAAAIRAGGSDD
jgi:hypothetical protein